MKEALLRDALTVLVHIRVAALLPQHLLDLRDVLRRQRRTVAEGLAMRRIVDMHLELGELLVAEVEAVRAVEDAEDAAQDALHGFAKTLRVIRCRRTDVVRAVVERRRREVV